MVTLSLDDRVRIIFVHHGPVATDGAFVSLYELLRSLDQAKYEPIVVLTKPGSASEKIAKLGITVLYAYPMPVFHHIVFEDAKGIPLTNVVGILKLLASLVPAWPLMRILRQQKPHIVHLNGIRYTSAALAAWFTGVPIVWHVREMPADGIFGIRKAILSFLIKKLSSAVILISDHQAVALPGIAQSLVIHNPIDANRFNRMNVECSYLSEEFSDFVSRKKILYVGYVSKPKGIEDLVEAFALIVAEMPEAALFLVGSFGSSDFEKIVRYRIEELELRGHVILTGHRTDIPALMKFSDVVVFPSRLRAIGRSVIEAAAMGKPAVATVDVNTSDMIIDGVTGYLISPKNPIQLAKTVSMLLSDEKLARQMGEAAHQHLGITSSVEIYAQRIEKVYEAVLEDDPEKLNKLHQTILNNASISSSE